MVKSESFQLKVIGAESKVTYSSSKSKVATVSKTGLIRGKKRGKTVITAKVGKKKYKCTVQVTTMQDSYMKRTRTQINKVRRNYGLTALDYDKYLQAAAKKRASELATKYSHIRPNGTQFTSAISLKYDYGSYCYEIIARAYTSPQTVVNAWMNNAATKKAIVGKAYEDIGAGYFVADDGTEYWCVIVAAKK